MNKATGRFQCKHPNKSNTPKDMESFWKTARENYEEVKKWPKWKQKIAISAKTASTGQFIMSEEEWRERYGNE